MKLLSDLEVCSVVAVDDQGKVIPASDPDKTDVWFLFTNPHTALIYNGERALLCRMIPSEGDPGALEYWVDPNRTIEHEFYAALDKLIEAYNHEN